MSYCPCNFDVQSVHPVWSADWYRAHKAHHLTVFPDVDQITIDNLTQSVRIAEEREASS